jgi:putative transposase
LGIESSYRLKHQSRIRTTTKNPVVRLLYVGIAFLLVDWWVYLTWTAISFPRKGARLLYTACFPFTTMLRLLRQAIDRHHTITEAIYLKERDFVMY